MRSAATTLSVSDAIAAQAPAVTAVACRHCGAPCPGGRGRQAVEHAFCCLGCETVFDLLHAHGMARFYQLDARPGVRPDATRTADEFAVLDDAATRCKIVDYADGVVTRVTFRIPAIHCMACVWLLEHLYQLRAGIGACQVNFPRRELTVQIEDATLSLRALAGFLASLGYAPEINLGLLERGRRPAADGSSRLLIQLGVAGFAFGNVMLLCFPEYLGLPADDALFRPLLGWLAAALATPVFFYSARDYWRTAALCLRQRSLSVEFPIFIGLAALYLQSLFTALAGGGPAYFDSFTGLVLFLLCSRWFQQRTHAALAFDRDFRAYFPLSITRRDAAGDKPVPVMTLQPGDRILVRNRELVPADARLVGGSARIDYSYVTGESTPRTQTAGDQVYAGGRQVGPAIELEVVRPVSQSRLAALWDHPAFRKENGAAADTLTRFAGRYFTYMVLALAAFAGTVWAWADPPRAVQVLASVLIVACPCALALAAPFALGAAQNVLARRGIYLKSPGVLEALARVDALVFDKTGTLTQPTVDGLRFDGNAPEPASLARAQALAAQSTHPQSRMLTALLERHGRATGPLSNFHEEPGLGLCGEVGGHALRLGSRRWLTGAGIAVPPATENASEICLAEDGRYLGRLVAGATFRPGLPALLARLRGRTALAVLSGDNDRDRAALATLFGPRAELRFGQSPETKLDYIRSLQASGCRVAMIGDGLNDAGALKQSDVGIAVTDDAAAFSPACDVLWPAQRLAALPAVLRYAKLVMAVVAVCFLVSFAYNAIGLTLAVSGKLSPLASAVLMPASSLTIVTLALAGARLAARLAGLKGAGP